MVLARGGANLTLTPGCYPDMAPPTSPWALTEVGTWPLALTWGLAALLCSCDMVLARGLWLLS